MLELLAQEAPESEFEEVVRQARRGGARAGALDRLSRAKDLSLGIRALFARRQQREAGLSALVDTARDLTLPYHLDALLKVITRRARLLLGLDMSWVTFHDFDAGCSRVRAADGHASAITVGFEVPMQGGVGSQATQRSAPFWSADYLPDDSFAHSDTIDDVVRAEGLHAIMAVPLQSEESTFGVLYVADRRIRHFAPDEVSLMSSLGDLAAVAIEKTRLLERTRDEVAELELDTSRAKDSFAAAREFGDAHPRLLDLLLDGGDLTGLAGEAANLLQGSLLIRDPAGRRLASVGELPELDASELDTLCLDTHTERRPIRSQGGVWLCPAASRDEMLGTLVLVPHDPQEPFTEHQIELLRSVAQITAVLLLMRRSAAAAEGQVRDLLFNDLLSGSRLPPAQLAERARRLSVDLEEPHTVAVARPEGGIRGRAVVWASSYAHRLSGLKSVDGDCIVMLLPGTDPVAVGEALSSELSTVLGSPVTVGAAGPTTNPADIIGVHQEARRCLEAVTALGGVGVAVSPQELGFLGLLLSDSPNTVGFINRTIGPVLDYDAQQATELARTLEAYFASASSPTRAAETLHVHPNTVSRRLERITELLGAAWQEPARALEVQLALQLQRTRRALVRRGGARTGRARG
ncbi:helix-turn-helix domain-containing protein [Streptomyces sp. PR69]|uniref:helix-turn-helix domain-containing protein n=1 Tax=Streptomyces sp. PR69 TaxID=2984950 RepID=UPI0022646D03|nr:GAF domain-containing protein [Streptomyces sp. PR69]